MNIHPSSKGRLGLWSALVLTLAASPVLAQGMGAGGPSPVTVISAEAGDYTLTIPLPGRIKASTVAEVRPQVSGIVEERLFKEGTVVEKGQPLYKIEDSTYRAAVSAAKAAVSQAQANFELAQINAKRARELFASNAGTAQNRDTANAQLDAAQAALEAAQAQQNTAEIDLDRTTVTAPVAGVIGLSQTTVGALVSTQQASAMTTIRTLDPVYVDVTQSATDILRMTSTEEGRTMRATGEVSLTLPDGSVYPYKGRLDAAEPQVEPTTGMVTLRMTFPNPDTVLLPGLYVEVEMPQTVAKGAIALPQNTVMRDGSGAAYVWVVADGKVAQRPVTVAQAMGNTWIITQGVNPGDQVITSGFQKTGPGAPVTVVPADGAAAGAAAGAGAAPGTAKQGGSN